MSFKSAGFASVTRMLTGIPGRALKTARVCSRLECTEAASPNCHRLRMRRHAPIKRSEPPLDNTSLLRVLSAGANQDSMSRSFQILRAGIELPRLSLEPRPDPRRSGCALGVRDRPGFRPTLSRKRRALPSSHTEIVHAAVAPERLVLAFGWRAGASTRIPNALHRVASLQPRCDLVFALHKRVERLAIWSHMTRPFACRRALMCAMVPVRRQTEA